MGYLRRIIGKYKSLKYNEIYLNTKVTINRFAMKSFS